MALNPGRDQNLAFVKELLRLDPAPSNLGKIFWKESNNSTWRYCLQAAINTTEGENEYGFIHNMVQHMREYAASKRPGHTLPPSPFMEREKNQGNTPLHLAVMKAPIDTTALENPGAVSLKMVSPIASGMEQAKKLVTALVEACPDALGVKYGTGDDTEKRGRTPYQERIFQLASKFHEWQTGQAEKAKATAMPLGNYNDDCAEPDQGRAGEYQSDDERDGEPENDKKATELSFAQRFYGDDEFRYFVISDPIASYISHYCVTEMTTDKAMDSLYRRGEGPLQPIGELVIFAAR